MAATAGLRRLIQTRSIGGSADTDAAALTVTPKRPAGPSVATTLTLVTAPLIAVTKTPRSAEASEAAELPGPARSSGICWQADIVPSSDLLDGARAERDTQPKLGGDMDLHNKSFRGFASEFLIHCAGKTGLEKYGPK